MPKLTNIAVLASGKGTNFAALALGVRRKKLPAKIKLLITDKRNALARKKAKNLGIKDIFINPKEFKSRLTYERRIVKLLKQEKVELVLLAGYMRILSPFFINCFKQKILNIHPALLPAFRGTDAIGRAFRYGCKITGVTVHFVDSQVDQGPVILQEAIKITPGMNQERLEAKIHCLEHKLYPQALKLILDKRVKIRNRDVRII